MAVASVERKTVRGKTPEILVDGNLISRSFDAAHEAKSVLFPVLERERVAGAMGTIGEVGKPRLERGLTFF